jgi:omega-amidase
MTNLIVSIVQYNIVWEDKQANFKKIEKLIRQDKSTDLFVLPEMFSTGFSMNTLSMAEETGGPTVKWMQKIAKEKEAAVCGSIMIKEKGSCFNRLVFVHPEGNIEKYDKRHLFTMGNEQK